MFNYPASGTERGIVMTVRVSVCLSAREHTVYLLNFSKCFHELPMAVARSSPGSVAIRGPDAGCRYNYRSNLF